ncbi:MAG: hypothetical protein ACTS80_01545 [Candidatus Hodgkinia cicadicola]
MNGKPVATAKVFKSKIISSFGKPTTFVNSLCALLHICNRYQINIHKYQICRNCI